MPFYKAHPFRVDGALLTAKEKNEKHQSERKNSGGVFLLKKVAVIFGGDACEREISIITGTFACNVLRGGKYDVLPVYLDEKGRAFTSESFLEIGAFQRKDCMKKAQRILINEATVYALNEKNQRLKPVCGLVGALNCCHGGLGEGGGVSAWMEMQGVPLASPSIAASAVCLDKDQKRQYMYITKEKQIMLKFLLNLQKKMVHF